MDTYRAGSQTYEECSILEVFAYYNDKEADEGTILRFMEPKEGIGCKLPGIEVVPAKFHGSCMPAYFDHWVSNGMS